MRKQDKEQVQIIIQNIHHTKKKIPYFQDLQVHPIYGQFFSDLDGEDIELIQDIINEYIKDQLFNHKTKGGEIFQRFYVLHQDEFWRFRELNAHEEYVQQEEFQTLGKKIEQELFKFENILTQNMLKKPQGLEKTINAFYDIVYAFFPLYGQIH